MAYPEEDEADSVRGPSEISSNPVPATGPSDVDDDVTVRSGVESSEDDEATQIAGEASRDGRGEIRRLGPYLIRRELGRGGQGVVYLAEDTRLKREVALKAMTGLGPDAELHLQRFWREAEVASKLDHPGICGVIDTGVDNGIPYIAMRYVRGQTLAQRIATIRDRSDGIDPGVSLAFDFEESEFSDGESVTTGATATATTRKSESSPDKAEFKDLLQLVERCARALQAAHDEGVVHRDIKPANIMIGRDGRPVILDFGLARDDSEDGGPTLTATGDVFGTPAYMSPEQLTGQRSRLDGRTDVYSLGVTLFECLALKRPFEAPTRDGLYQAILHREAPGIRKFCRWAPSDLEVVIQTALEKDPNRRYVSAGALADDLAAVRESRPIAARPVGPLGRALRFSQRRPVAAGFILTLVLGLPLVAGLAGYIYAHRDDIVAQENARIEAQVEELVGDGFFEIHHESPAAALVTFDEALELRPKDPGAVGGRALTLIELGRPADALRDLDALNEVPALLRVKALALRELDRDEEATAADARIAEGTPSHLDAFIAAQVLMRQGHEAAEAGQDTGRGDIFIEARATFERAIALSERPRLAYYLGYAHASSHIPFAFSSPPIIEAMLTLWPKNGWSWYWASTASLMEPELALERLDRAAVLDPEIRIADRRVTILCELGRGEEALPLARSVVAERPEDVLALRSLSYAQLKSGLIEEAEMTLSRILELDPADLMAHCFLVDVHTGRGEFEEALADCDEAMRRRPKDTLLFRLRAHILHKLQRFDEARAACRRFLEIHPGDRDGESLLAGIETLSENHEEAAVIFRRLLAADPDDHRLNVNLSGVLASLGDKEGALASAKKAMAIDDSGYETRVNYAKALLVSGELKEAKRVLDETETLFPKEPRVLSSLADLAGATGRRKEAIAYMRRVAELEPDFRNLGRLGNELTGAGQVQEGIAYLERAVAERPLTSLLYALGMAYFAADRGKDAIKTYERLLEVDPDHPEGNCNLGLYYAREGRTDDAIRLLRHGHRLGSKRSDWANPSHVWLSQILADQAASLFESDPKRAIALGLEANELNADYPYPHLVLATCYVEEKTPEEARDGLRALYHAQKFIALVGRQPYPLYILAKSLVACDLIDSAEAVVDEIDGIMGGKDKLPFTLAMAKELRGVVEAKRKAMTSD